MNRERRLFGIEIFIDGEKEPLKKVIEAYDKEEALYYVTKRCDKCKYLNNKVRLVAHEIYDLTCDIELIGCDYEIIQYAYHYSITSEGIEIIAKPNMHRYEELYNFELFKFFLPYYLLSFHKYYDEDEYHLLFTYDIEKGSIIHPKTKVLNCIYKNSPSGIQSICHPLYSYKMGDCKFEKSFESKLDIIRKKYRDIKKSNKFMMYFKLNKWG